MSTHQPQVNNSGAWKTVLDFDGSDAVKKEHVRRAAQLLYDATAGVATFRIYLKGSIGYEYQAPLSPVYNKGA